MSSEAELEKLRHENVMLKAKIYELERVIKKFTTPPSLVATVVELHGDENVVIRLSNGNEVYTNIHPDYIGKIQPGDRIIVDQNSLTIMGTLGTAKQFDVDRFVVVERPTVTWEDIGGLDQAIMELKEVVELPLINPELFNEIGIKPPKGVLLHGPPGTGKTLMAKAVANSTGATYIEVVGSELAQKFIGEGAKLVRDIFALARERAPSIVFIDELDAIAAKRIEIGTSGEREVQRTFMQLLAELDGFRPLDNVKVIGATNRPDILDPAITRPGRLDRLINVGLPDFKGRLQIFKIHTRNMKLKDINFEEIAATTENMSGAEIRAICTEAGYFAIRKKRRYVTHEDFIRAIQKVRRDEGTKVVYSMFK